MKSLGYIGAFLGGAIAGAALGILIIKLSRKEVVDLVDDIEDATEEE